MAEGKRQPSADGTEQADEIREVVDRIAELVRLYKLCVDAPLLIKGAHVPRVNSPWLWSPVDHYGHVAWTVRKWLLESPRFLFAFGLSAKEAHSLLFCDAISLESALPVPLPTGAFAISRDGLHKLVNCTPKRIRKADESGQITRVSCSKRGVWYDFASVCLWAFGSKKIPRKARRREELLLWRTLFLDADIDEIDRIKVDNSIADPKNLNRLLPPVALKPPEEFLSLIAPLRCHEMRLLAAMLITWYRKKHGTVTVSSGGKAGSVTKYEVAGLSDGTEGYVRATMILWALRGGNDVMGALGRLHGVTPLANCPFCNQAERFVSLKSAPSPPKKYGYRCPSCGREFWQTVAEHYEFWQEPTKRAKENFDLLNQGMPEESRITKAEYDAYISLYKNEYHSRAGDFADIGTGEIARTLGRPPHSNSTSNSLTAMYERLGDDDRTFGQNRFYREYLNPLTFLMWFLDMFGLKDLRNLLPSLTGGFIAAFLRKCPLSDEDFRLMRFAAPEASLAFLTTGLQPESPEEDDGEQQQE